MVVRRYLPQTQEIKDVVQNLVSAGIPDFKHDQMWLDFRGDKVEKIIGQNARLMSIVF